MPAAQQLLIGELHDLQLRSSSSIHFAWCDRPTTVTYEIYPWTGLVLCRLKGPFLLRQSSATVRTEQSNRSEEQTKRSACVILSRIRTQINRREKRFRFWRMSSCRSAEFGYRIGGHSPS